MAGVTRNGATRARNHIVDSDAVQNAHYSCRSKHIANSRKKCTVTLSALRVSRPVSSGAPIRTAAQRILRSLNSLGVVVADSVPAVRDIEATHRP